MSLADKKTILLLSSSIGVYGAERVTLELAQEAAKNNLEPIIGGIENQNPCHAELSNTAQSLGIKTTLFACRKPFDPRTALEIRQFVATNKIDIIHSQGYKANFYAQVSGIFSKVPCMATCHPWLETDFSIKAKFYTFLDKLLLKRFKKIVAISDGLKRELLNAGIPNERITIIENGVDVSKFSKNFDTDKIRKTFDIPSRTRVIGTIGRLSPEKGHFDFLRAAKLLRSLFDQVIFMIVGDGPLRHELETECAELGLKNDVIFTGVRDDIPQLLSLMDIFVLPSHTEAMPMALLEAMAAGKPVIAASVGAIPKIIENGKSGIIVPPADSNELKDAMADLLSDKTKAAIHARNAHAEILKNYSSQQMAQKYLELYEQLSSNGKFRSDGLNKNVQASRQSSLGSANTHSDVS